MPKRQWSLCVPILKAAGPMSLNPSCLELSSRCWDGQLFSRGKPGSSACPGLQFSLGWPCFCGWSSSTLILVSVHSKAEIPGLEPTERTYVFYVYKYVFLYWIEWPLKVTPSLKFYICVCSNYYAKRSYTWVLIADKDGHGPTVSILSQPSSIFKNVSLFLRAELKKAKPKYHQNTTTLK